MLSLGLINSSPRHEDVWEEWRYSSTILNLSTRWRCVQLHTLAVLSPEKQRPVSTVQEAEWAPEPVWTFWRREKSPTPTGN
jgi:hypothetical protein